MQQRAGLLFLCKSSKRILLIHDNQRWTVPTFARKTVLLDDVQDLFQDYSSGKIVPIELYLSEDRGFEYGTYVCIVKEEFLTPSTKSLAWCRLEDLPKNLHTGLKITLNNTMIRIKIDTILELDDAIN